MVRHTQHSNPLLWKQWKTALMIALFGSIPLFIGRKLRRFVYRFILGQIGFNVTLEAGLELMNPEAILIGNDSSVSANGVLNCSTPNSKIIIRDQVSIERGVFLSPLGGCIEIDDRVFIGPYVCVAGPGKIKIGKDCLIASHSSMYANNHNFADPHLPINQQGLNWKGIVIEDDCWLGTGVRVLDGVTIGKGSVIGAGAVVTKSIPPYSIAVGVPAKVIDRRDSSKKSNLLQARK
ncbi:MAG: acyltransferase [Kovacikia sp.]